MPLAVDRTALRVEGAGSAWIWPVISASARETVSGKSMMVSVSA